MTLNMIIFEAIGAATVLLGGAYFLIKYMENRESIEKEKKKLIANNDKCKELISKYNKSVKDGEPIMTNEDLKKNLFKIIDDPKEAQKALEKINLNYDIEERSKIEHEKWKANRKKIQNKYEDEIFEIFDVYRELEIEEILSRTKFKFKMENDDAIQLLNIWITNALIQNCNWNDKKYEIGYVLERGEKTEMTRSKWLEQNGKTLVPKSKEFENYLKNRSDDLPF